MFGFGGRDATVYGDNATGKTTLFNAITWLLFDKASTGAKNFTPKTKGPDGDLNYLDHGVEATFVVDGGRQLTLAKVYKEVYKKKKGSAHEEFSGHETDYFINGVPAKEKEYLAALANLVGTIEQAKILMMPHYFAEEVTWQNRRSLLLEVCGDISDHDVIDGNEELADLMNYLVMPGTTDKHYSVEEYKKIADAKRREINKELGEIRPRIDEAKKAMPDVTGIDVAAIDAKISNYNVKIGVLEEEKRHIASGDAKTQTAIRGIAAAKTRLAESRAAYTAEQAEVNEDIYGEIAHLKDIRRGLEENLSNKEASEKSKKIALQTMQSSRQSLLDEYSKRAAEVWQGSEHCPTCRQPLPEDEVAQAVEAFNLAKSQRLEEINRRGKQECNQDMIDILIAEIDALGKEIFNLIENQRDMNTLVGEAEAKIKSITPFEETEIHAEIMKEIADLQNVENNSADAFGRETQRLNGEIADIRREVDVLMAEKSKVAMVAQQTARIDELMAKENNLSAEHESVEHGVFLCEEFIRAKVAMLTDNINSRFKSVRFRLFIEQINGGLKEDCEVLVPGENRLVPYSTANNAAKINAGLEIIDALSKHWGLSVPVFVDNAESVTQLQDIDGQLIRLVVSEHDKSLRLEHAN